MISSLSKHAPVIHRGQPWRYCEYATIGIRVLDGPDQAIRVSTQPNWIRTPPLVCCAGIPDWLRSGEEWHADRDTGYLCYEYDQHWTRHFSLLRKEGLLSFSALQDLAAQWIINSTSFLLHVHYKCEQNGRTTWPSTVRYWEHIEEDANRQLGKLISKKLTS